MNYSHTVLDVIIEYSKYGFNSLDESISFEEKLIYYVGFKLAFEGFQGYSELGGRFEDYSWKAVHNLYVFFKLLFGKKLCL